MARQATILLGVTGSIAAYKAVELARLLHTQKLSVKVAMSKAACEFVTPLTFRAITGNAVATSMFAPEQWKAAHVSLADEADLIVVAPATANAIARLAFGIADEILYSTVLASHAPLIVAPAMHSAMYEHDATRKNLATLRRRGAVIVEAETGELASGDIGPGRLADLERIVSAVMTELQRRSDLEGLSVVVTAGGTQEPLDPVRYLGNRSSGKMGYAIAAECARRGAQVTLVSAPTALAVPAGVERVDVVTGAEMSEAVSARFDEAEAVVMAAAVTDFAPAQPSAAKIKKGKAPSSIALVRNPDVLAELGKRKGRRVLIGFAAETDDVAANARAKLGAKNLDLVVGNDVSEPGIGFGSDENEVVLIDADRDESLPRLSKTEVARHVVDRLAKLLA